MELMKFQSDATGMQVLIYNEDRSTFAVAQGEEAQAIMKVLFGGVQARGKTYAEAEVQVDGKIVIDENSILESPEWWPDW